MVCQSLSVCFEAAGNALFFAVTICDAGCFSHVCGPGKGREIAAALARGQRRGPAKKPARAFVEKREEEEVMRSI